MADSDGRRGIVARIAFWAGPALALILIGATDEGLLGTAMTPKAGRVAAVTVWVAIWWIAESVPIAATSLLPMLLFPLLEIMPVDKVVKPYMSPFIVLLMAGFMAALAIERWELHKRLSLRVLLAVGTSPSRLVLGMMIAAAMSSMWISNTATTLMMLPIAMALLRRAELAEGADPEQIRRFGVAMFLGLAYAASVGGLGTPIGTPPNLIFMGIYHRDFPELPPIAFLDWMRFGIPIVLVLLPLIWLTLTRVYGRLPASLGVSGRDILRRELRGLGPMNADEKAVAAVFGSMALLWITRKITLGNGDVVGWAPALGLTKAVDDSTVAVFGALALFAWPSRTRPGERLLDWATAVKIPWDVVLLFGGGIALAAGFGASGLSGIIVDQLEGLKGLPVPVLVLIIALLVTFLTEVTSNTATATVLMPVLASFAAPPDMVPTQIMIPAVLSCSCAFMLPVATAPNAIVYGSGRVSMKEMARAGLVLNLIGAVVITLMTMLLL